MLAVSILAATTAPLAAQLINVRWGGSESLAPRASPPVLWQRCGLPCVAHCYLPRPPALGLLLGSLQVITDTAKLQQVADFSKSDPISSVALVSLLRGLLAPWQALRCWATACSSARQPQLATPPPASLPCVSLVGCRPTARPPACCHSAVLPANQTWHRSGNPSVGCHGLRSIRAAVGPHRRARMPAAPPAARCLLRPLPRCAIREHEAAALCGSCHLGCQLRLNQAGKGVQSLRLADLCTPPLSAPQVTRYAWLPAIQRATPA